MGMKFSFLSNLTQQSSSTYKVVGVDIGSSSIKVVELHDKEGILTLATYGELQLGPYADKSIGESVTVSAKQEQAALIDILRESAVSAKEAVFAMPLSSSFVTNVSLVAEPDADLSPLVRIEARKVIPASLSEVTLDWAEVSNPTANRDKSSNATHKILIAAIQNNALERFKTLMKFAGLNEPPTEIECFSTVRSLYRRSDSQVAIIDIGSVSTKLFIANQGSLMRMHRVRAGGSYITEEISKELKLSFEEAELKKQTIGKSDTDHATIKKIHTSHYERPLREFKQVIAEYEKNNDCKIERVYLSGGGAVFESVLQQVSQSLEQDVLLADPFRKVAYPAFMEDTLHKIGPSFTVALGAALRQFE